MLAFSTVIDDLMNERITTNDEVQMIVSTTADRLQ